MALNVPLISIIVPVYNVEKYLTKCLDSLVGQTYKNLEIICVDDGSPDHSIDILKAYESRDSRIKIISQKNTGQSGARNTGLSHATGDYIMFVDSDDWIDLTTCELAMQEDADVVFWSYYREYGDKRLETSLYGNQRVQWNRNNISELHRRMVGLSGSELRNPEQTDSLITVWGKLYKSSVLANQQFVDTRFIGNEDALFNISAFFNVQSAVYLPTIHSHYRKDNQSSLTSGKYNKELVVKWRQLYRRIRALLNEHSADSSFYRALENRRALGILQLGMLISAASDRKLLSKKKELKRIITSRDYKNAIRQLPITNMPIYWKVFFITAKAKMYITMLLMLKAMSFLRSKT